MTKQRDTRRELGRQAEHDQLTGSQVIMGSPEWPIAPDTQCAVDSGMPEKLIDQPAGPARARATAPDDDLIMDVQLIMDDVRLILKVESIMEQVCREADDDLEAAHDRLDDDLIMARVDKIVDLEELHDQLDGMLIKKAR